MDFLKKYNLSDKSAKILKQYSDFGESCLKFYQECVEYSEACVKAHRSKHNDET